MFLLKWHHLKKDNKKLHKQLGVEKGTQINLHFSDGFLISPDDNVNRAAHLPKIINPKSIVEVFKDKYPKIYGDVEKFYKMVGGFDRLDYQKFKKGAKIAYFFAATYYLYSNGINNLGKVKTLYKDDYREEIEKRLSNLLSQFIELASHRGQKIELFSLFKFAISIIKEVSSNIEFSSEFSNLTNFLRSMKYYPYGILVGNEFEREVQEIFENEETKNEKYLAKQVHSRVNEKGVLIPLDEDEEFRKIANKKANGMNVPDYLFITTT